MFCICMWYRGMFDDQKWSILPMQFYGPNGTNYGIRVCGISYTYRLQRLALLDQIWSILHLLTYRLLRLALLDQIWSILHLLTYRLLRLALLDQIWSILHLHFIRLLRLAVLDQIWSILYLHNI